MAPIPTLDFRTPILDPVTSILTPHPTPNPQTMNPKSDPITQITTLICKPGLPCTGPASPPVIPTSQHLVKVPATAWTRHWQGNWGTDEPGSLEGPREAPPCPSLKPQRRAGGGGKWHAHCGPAAPSTHLYQLVSVIMTCREASTRQKWKKE